MTTSFDMAASNNLRRFHRAGDVIDRGPSSGSHVAYAKLGITFSMTLLALALAQPSSQYTSRILRNFMRSRVTQAALGVFVGIFAYCLIVLRTIRGNGVVDEFVPSLALSIDRDLMMFLNGIWPNINARPAGRSSGK